MPSYKIYDQWEVSNGVLYKVELIPEIEGGEAHVEMQEYLVETGQNVEDVLSAAAWNHEDHLSKIAEEPAPKEEPQPVKAKAKDQINL